MTLLEQVEERFRNEPELKEYISALKKSKISNQTLSNFLTENVDYIKRYFFWVYSTP